MSISARTASGSDRDQDAEDDHDDEKTEGAQLSFTGAEISRAEQIDQEKCATPVAVSETATGMRYS